MTTRQLNGQRLIATSHRSFENAVTAFEAAIGHPNMDVSQNEIGAARTCAEIKVVIQRALGKSGFMELVRLDFGAILRKEGSRERPESLCFLIGNPLVMKEKVKHLPNAGSFAPVTVLIDERSDGVHSSYGTMGGLPAPYGSPDALKVVQDLNLKVQELLNEAAAGRGPLRRDPCARIQRVRN